MVIREVRLLKIGICYIKSLKVQTVSTTHDFVYKNVKTIIASRRYIQGKRLNLLENVNL